MKSTRYFEWIAGEDAGEICILSHVEFEDGETYLHFTNGDVCNIMYVSEMTTNKLDLKDKFMVEIMGPSYAWTFEQTAPKIFVDYESKEAVEVPSLNDILRENGNTNIKSDELKLVPPHVKLTTIPSLPSIDDWGLVKENKRVDTFVSQNNIEPLAKDVVVSESLSEHTVETKKETCNHNTFDPVSILVSTCKKHKTEIDLTLTINLPSKSMYIIADGEFENGGDKFIDFVVKDIDTNMIIESIKDSLKQYYSGVVENDNSQ